MKQFIITLLVLCLARAVSAQLTFYFVPDIYARNIDGLGNFQVQNLQAGNMQGRISIMVQETVTKAQVVTITTPVHTFSQGMSTFPRALFGNSVFSFGNHALAKIVNQTRTFPPGEYNICFRFVPADKLLNDEYESCFETTVQPLLPLSLILPADQDTICLKRPVLSWQPPMPYHPSMRFRLLLTEKNGKDAAESILKNVPLLLLDNISGTTLNYPSNYPELKEGKTYCWQVAAYQQGTIISTSEVWEFTVQCREPEKPAPADSYRELKSLVNGNYYIANRFLKFSFLNNYNITALNYSIHSLEKGGEKIKNTPVVKIRQGLNKIDIDLTELDLEPGKQYLLKVVPFNESPVEIRFTYKDE